MENEQPARLLADYLFTRGISTHAEAEGQHFAIWVRDENQIGAAREILHEFLAEPEHPRFREAGNRAQQLRAEHQRRVTQVAEKTVEMRRVWNQPLSRRAPLVFALVGLSVFATLTTEFAQNSRNPFLNILDRKSVV